MSVCKSLISCCSCFVGVFLLAYVSQCLPVSLFSTELYSNHPFNFSTVGIFFLIKAKIKQVEKEPAPVEVVAMWNSIMWNRCSSGLVSVVRVKNPITGWDRNNQNTSYQSHSSFSFPLTPTHYSLPHSFIHLSEVFQVVAFYLSSAPLPSFISIDILISGLISNLFKTYTLLFFSPRSFAPFFTSSLLKLISSSLPCLYLCLYFFLIFILYTSRQLHELFPLQDFCKCYLKLIYLNFNLEHQTIARNRNLWIIYISLSSHSLYFLYQYKPTLPFILSSTDVL